MPIEPEFPSTDLEPTSALQRDLKSLWGTGGEATSATDEAVFGAARSHFARRRRLRLVRRVGGFAAAAGLALALFLMRGPQSSGTEIAVGLHADPYDVDGSGRVDIVDALVLARAVERGRAAADLTGDGRVDHSDIDAVSARAVRIDR